MYTLTLELELGRVGAPQPTHEGAAHRLGIWARAPEGPPHTRLDGAQGDPLPVTPDEQRHVGTANGKDRAPDVFAELKRRRDGFGNSRVPV